MAKRKNEKPGRTAPKKDKELPFHQVLAELEEIHRKFVAKKGEGNAARSQSKPRYSSKVMAKGEHDNPKLSRPRKDKKLQAIYDRVRREFSAADLQKYTEIDPMVPIEKVLADLEKLDRQLSAKEKEKTNARSQSKRRKV